MKTLTQMRTETKRLVLAAPDLLEACKFVLSQLRPEPKWTKQTILYSDCMHPFDDDKTVVDLLSDAINKAEGR